MFYGHRNLAELRGKVIGSGSAVETTRLGTGGRSARVLSVADKAEKARAWWIAPDFFARGGRAFPQVTVPIPLLPLYPRPTHKKEVTVLSGEQEHEIGPVSFEYIPNLVESENGFVYDQGKLAALVRHVLKHAKPEDRAYAIAHPGLDLRPRDDLLQVLVAHDGRVRGGFEVRLLRRDRSAER
jgi:hypothetical protein